MHLARARIVAVSLLHCQQGADLPFLGSQGQHGPTSPPRPGVPFPSTGAVLLLAGTKGKGRKPKGKPCLTLKTPEDREINCHHTKPTGGQQTVHPQLVPENHSKGVGKHDPRRSSAQVWLTFCQKAGKALLYTKLNKISFLILLSFISWPMLNYLNPSFITIPRLFFTQPLASHLAALNGLH